MYVMLSLARPYSLIARAFKGAVYLATYVMWTICSIEHMNYT